MVIFYRYTRNRERGAAIRAANEARRFKEAELLLRRDTRNRNVESNDINVSNRPEQSNDISQPNQQDDVNQPDRSDHNDQENEASI